MYRDKMFISALKSSYMDNCNKPELYHLSCSFQSPSVPQLSSISSSLFSLLVPLQAAEINWQQTNRSSYGEWAKYTWPAHRAPTHPHSACNSTYCTLTEQPRRPEGATKSELDKWKSIMTQSLPCSWPYQSPLFLPQRRRVEFNSLLNTGCGIY